MKIAILSFYSGHMERGVENWTFQIAQRLQKNNDVTVFQNGPAQKYTSYKIFSTHFDVDWNKNDSDRTFKRKIFVDYWSLLIARQTLAILKELFVGRYEIVIPTNGGWQTAFIRILTWITRKKMVVVGHSGIGWDDANNIYCFPNIFVCLSTQAKMWVKKINPFIKSDYIPNGVDLNVFSNVGSKVKIKIPKPIVLMVGAPVKGKRMELAIEAVSNLKKASLLILGGGYEEERIKILGKKLLGQRFLIKKVDFTEIPKYYRSCDLFTLPSWSNEAFGMVYLEAMACGLPVVATDDDLRREIVGDAGILVDPTDINAYTKALEKALKTEWGEKPRKQAEKFSWEKVVKEYENLFGQLISK